jgi:hypothetical protein
MGGILAFAAYPCRGFGEQPAASTSSHAGQVLGPSAPFGCPVCVGSPVPCEG